jgi:hypothetical protein
MAAVFVDGLPQRIAVADFKDAYLAAFPKFTNAEYDPIIEDAINAVYTMFNGAQYLWKSRDTDTWYDKTVRCYLYLVAWYIVNLYPRMSAGIQSTGGMPILAKKIGDVTIHYMDSSRLSTADDVLNSLKSNPYGNMALMMIRSAPARFAMHVIKAYEPRSNYGNLR